MTVGPAHKPATFTPSFQLFQGCLLFKAHYHGCDIDIYVSLSLSISKTPNSPSRNTRQTSTPIPINIEGSDSARFLLQFYLIGPFCSPYNLPPGNWVSLDPSYIGKLWKIWAIRCCCCCCSCWQSLDWIGFDGPSTTWTWTWTFWLLDLFLVALVSSCSSSSFSGRIKFSSWI